MNSGEQLRLWVGGKSIHNKKRDECCPDFSCCQPHLLVPEHERKAFAEAHRKEDEKTKSSMLFEFLGRAFSSPKVYVAGDKENYKDEKEVS